MAKEIIRKIDKIIMLRFVGKMEQGNTESVDQKIEALGSSKTPILLIDLQQLELPDDTAKTEMKRLFTDLKYTKMALLGHRPQVMASISHLLKSVKDNSNIKLFRDEDLAKQWLVGSRGVLKF